MVGGKYQPLTEWLIAANERGERIVRLRFGEVEEIAGPLPASARMLRTWWANSSHSQALAWAAADWHVSNVDLATERVEFTRGRKGGSYAARGFVPGSARARRGGAGKVPVLRPSGATERASVWFDWLDAGRITLSSGRLEFPSVPAQPGIYRMSFPAQRVGGRPACYIGETDNLARRMGNYRNPGPRQQTSLRISGLLVDHLGMGGSIVLEIATEAMVQLAGLDAASLDLRRKAPRLLAESAALVAAQVAGGGELHNLG